MYILVTAWIYHCYFLNGTYISTNHKARIIFLIAKFKLIVLLLKKSSIRFIRLTCTYIFNFKINELYIVLKNICSFPGPSPKNYLPLPNPLRHSPMKLHCTHTSSRLVNFRINRQNSPILSPSSA